MRVLRPSQDFEIVRPVVCLHLIAVMSVLGREQRATDLLGCHDAVLELGRSAPVGEPHVTADVFAEATPRAALDDLGAHGSPPVPWYRPESPETPAISDAL